MRKIAGFLAFVFILSSCGGYFSQENPNSAGSDGVAEISPLSLSGTNANVLLSSPVSNDITPFIFNDTVNNIRYIFFSSDRGGAGSQGGYDIYYAKIDGKGKFYDLRCFSNVNTSGSETFPLVYYVKDFYNMSSNLYLTLIRESPKTIVTYWLSNYDFNYAVQITSTNITNVTGIGLLFDHTNLYDVSLLLADGSGTIKKCNFNFPFGGWYWDGAQNILMGGMVNSVNGYFNNGLLGEQSRYAFFHIISSLVNNQLMVSYKDTNDGTFYHAQNKYQSTNRDITPYIDYLGNGEVYFASDRAGHGNYDLYRYNIKTFESRLDGTGYTPGINLSWGVYVSTNGNDGNIGVIPSAPMKTLQAALARAIESNRYNIYVEKGVYSPGNGLNAAGSNGLLLYSNMVGYGIGIYGGYINGFTGRNGYSVLQGSGTNCVIDIRYASDIILDGFQIQNGSNNYSGQGYGGGFFLMVTTNVTITNVLVTSNRAVYGGGMFAYYCIGLTVSGTYVSNNTSGPFGDAIIFFYISNASLVNAVIDDNRSAGSTNMAFHLYNAGSVDPYLQIRDCTFGCMGNTTNSYGIYEDYADQTNHILTGNAFATNKLRYLYWDYNGNHIITNDASWNNINIGGYTGAQVAFSNIAVFRP